MSTVTVVRTPIIFYPPIPSTAIKSDLRKHAFKLLTGMKLSNEIISRLLKGPTDDNCFVSSDYCVLRVPTWCGTLRRTILEDCVVYELGALKACIKNGQATYSVPVTTTNDGAHFSKLGQTMQELEQIVRRDFSTLSERQEYED